MPVPATINDLSTTESSNSPPGTETPRSADNYLRAHAAFIAQLRDGKVGTTDLASSGGAGMVGVDGATTVLDHVTKLPNGVNVLRYIAPAEWPAILDGTSTHDSTTEIQAAVTAMTNGGVLYMPGKYLCNVVIPGNKKISVIGERGKTVLQSATPDGWALTYSPGFISAPVQTLVVRDITFRGVSKRGNGLQNNLGSNLNVESCNFYNCGIGYLANATISYGMSHCDFYQCYLGAYLTCRTAAGAGTTLTTINSQSVEIQPAFFPQHPGDVTFTRVNWGLCDCSLFVEQPDNPFQKDSGIKFLGCLLQNGTVGALFLDIGGKLAAGASFVSAWFENFPAANTVQINGVSYSGCDIYVANNGTVKISDSPLTNLRVKSGATLLLDNVVFNSNTSVFDIDSDASVIGENIRRDFGVLPFYCKGFRSTEGSTSGRGSACIVGPHSTQSYRGAVDGSKLAANSLLSPNLLGVWGTGTRLNVSDGVLSTQSCMEVVGSPSNGVQFSGTPLTVGSYVAIIFAARATSAAFELRVAPDLAGAIHGVLDIPLKTKWQTFAIVGRGRTAGVSGSRSIFYPRIGTQTWRMSAIQMVEFSTEAELQEFLIGNEYLL
jgi:hypothetical protein